MRMSSVAMMTESSALARRVSLPDVLQKRFAGNQMQWFSRETG